ncbi:SH3 domain-containing protein [Streptomyces sp. NPDC001135]
MNKLSRTMLAVAAPVIALASVTVAAPTASASAASGCFNPPHPDKDSATGHVNAGQTAPLRVGFNSACGTVVTLKSNWKLYYHCVAFNGSSWWTHVRVEGSNLEGWVWDMNLNNGGSDKEC